MNLRNDLQPLRTAGDAEAPAPDRSSPFDLIRHDRSSPSGLVSAKGAGLLLVLAMAFGAVTTQPANASGDTRAAPASSWQDDGSATDQAGRFGPFDSAGSFLSQQYYDLRPSAPAADEFNQMAYELNAGMAPEAVIEQIVGEENWTVGSIVRQYAAYFQRDPDAGGLRYWFDQMRYHGVGDRQIAAFFAQSAEFRSTYGSLTNGQFVDLVYRNVLHRDPDPIGRAYWLSFLDRGVERWTVMGHFVDSNENLSNTENRTSRIQVHFGMLGRTPTAAWLAENREVPLQDVIGAILVSDAYADRFDD